MILPFTFGLALGLMIAGVFYIAWRGEKRISDQFRTYVRGEEQRNDDSFRAGMRMGHTAAQIDNLVFFPEANTSEEWTGSSYGALDDFFTDTTPNDFPTLVRTSPKDFPRPRGVITYPTDAA